MGILIFIAVIVVLIVVHELGHFIAAKIAGMRVDEFGIGYPPRALSVTKIGETEYTLNWLPFGGFVKIYGEDGEKKEGAEEDKNPRAFGAKNRMAQALVLVAGVAMNMVLAYILITGSLVAGTPRVLSEAEIAMAQQMELVVARVIPGTPAERAGLLAGDSIREARSSVGTWTAGTSENFSSFVSRHKAEDIYMQVKRNRGEESLVATPAPGVVPSDLHRYALGLEVVPVGVVPISFGNAVTVGATLTWELTVLTAKGLAHFFYGVFTFSADLSQVAGPVGIAGVVGSASSEGLGNLLSIAAIISINLALINLIPIPALDGGRLLFVIIESIIRRPIKARVAQSINAVGFLFLILLMLVVTVHDIFKIVS